jgi:threonine dehydrogenase-like Zn-dependent dehydrogenase
MKRASLIFSLLVLLMGLGAPAASAEVVEVVPGFELTLTGPVTVEVGSEVDAENLGDLFSTPQALACGTCLEAKRECALSCAEAGCIIQNWRCNTANPCNSNCFCFCN